MTTRLSINSFAGMERTDVAVGTSRLDSMLETTRAAGPRRRSTPRAMVLGVRSGWSCFWRYSAVGAWAVAMGCVTTLSVETSGAGLPDDAASGEAWGSSLVAGWGMTDARAGVGAESAGGPEP